MNHPSPDDLGRFADGLAGEDLRARVGAHVGVCLACKETVETWQDLGRLVRSEEVPSPPGYFEELPRVIVSRIEGSPRGGVPVFERGETGAARLAVARRTSLGMRASRWLRSPAGLAAAAALFVVIMGPWASRRVRDEPSPLSNPTAATQDAGGRGSPPRPGLDGAAGKSELVRPWAVPHEQRLEDGLRDAHEGEGLGFGQLGEVGPEGAPADQAEGSRVPNEASRHFALEGRSGSHVPSPGAADPGRAVGAASEAARSEVEVEAGVSAGVEAPVPPSRRAAAPLLRKAAKGNEDAVVDERRVPGPESAEAWRSRAQALEKRALEVDEGVRAALLVEAIEAWVKAWEASGLEADRRVVVDRAGSYLATAHRRYADRVRAAIVRVGD
jgi:hypothetical protein